MPKCYWWKLLSTPGFWWSALGRWARFGPFCWDRSAAAGNCVRLPTLTTRRGFRVREPVGRRCRARNAHRPCTPLPDFNLSTPIGCQHHGRAASRGAILRGDAADSGAPDGHAAGQRGSERATVRRLVSEGTLCPVAKGLRSLRIEVSERTLTPTVIKKVSMNTFRCCDRRRVAGTLSPGIKVFTDNEFFHLEGPS
jgi:hypothetical protein